MRSKKLLWLLSLALLTFMSVYNAVSAQSSEVIYKENQWNFVDGSMDISNGIPDDAGGVLERIKTAGKLRVATEPYFPPQEFIDSRLKGQDQYVGSDMELARLIAERMGVELEIVPMEFTNVLLSLESGQCDLAISALSYTPGRASSYTLSKGYFYSGDNPGSGLMIREADKDLITGIGDLAKRNIVAQSGSLQESQLAETVRNYREFRRVPTLRSVYIALIEEVADAAAVDYETARTFIENNPHFHLMLIPDVYFSLEPQFQGDRIAAKKGEAELIYFVNSVIDEVTDTGIYRQWYDDYNNYSGK